MIAGDITEVIAHLDHIVEETRTRRDPLGYFAAMYRAVTIRIKDDIDAGRFEDGPRMDRVDTTFANYYLRAYAAHRSGSTPSGPWQVAFEFAQRSTAGVFQHLLLGMNAHINFDLAQAVVEEHGDLPALAVDYTRINDVLVALLDPLQDRVASHLVGAPLVDCALGRLDESFGGWEMAKARAHAWEHAEELAEANDTERRSIVRHMDRYAVDLARHLLVPERSLAAAGWWVTRRLERTNVEAILDSITSVR